jgi:N-methylhydantoinase B
MGLRRQIRSEGHVCRTFIHGTRRLSSPWGLFGGGAGGRCYFTYSNDVDPPQKGYTFLNPGQSVTMVTPGAGGYGDPRTRDPALLARDVAEGKVSTRAARELYGHDDIPTAKT